MNRILKIIATKVFHVVGRSISLTSGKTFVNLFNMKSALIGSPSRIHCDGRRYIVRDKDVPSMTRVFPHQRQGNMAYEMGLKRRAEKMGARYFLDHIDFQAGDVVLDCGANLGDLKLYFDMKNVSVQYTGFEPSPLEFDCAMTNVAPGTLHNIGLWNAEGKLKFYVSSQGADSSLIEPSEYDETIEVDVKLLADFVAGPTKLLKLEAEGAEPEIIEGLGEKAELIEFISADLGAERGVREESTLAPVTNLLLSRGFEMIDVRAGDLCALYRNRNFPREREDL